MGFSILNKSGKKTTMLNVFKRAILRLLILLTIPLAITSCGSEGGQFAGGGIGGTGIYAGEITGFGSVWVSDIKFSKKVDSSLTVDDDDPITEYIDEEQHLKIGMYVKLKGSVNPGGMTGTYESVVYDDDVEGPISDLQNGDTPGTKTFTVLGMSVIIEENTEFYNETSSDFDFVHIYNDNVVEVSGFINGDGFLHATLIEKKGEFDPDVPGTIIEVEGTVSNFLGAETFTLNGLTVNFDESGVNTDLSELPPEGISNGLFVEVEGTLESGTVISADRIEEEEDDFEDDEDWVSVEGIVSDFVNLDNFFKVNGQLIDASSATFDPDDLTLTNGIEVEVEGPIVGGVLLAQEVELDD